MYQHEITYPKDSDVGQNQGQGQNMRKSLWRGEGGGHGLPVVPHSGCLTNSHNSYIDTLLYY